MTQFNHDGAGRLIGLITPANDTISLAHDAAGRPDLITFPNTLTIDFQYDLQGRLSDLTHIRGITELARFGYTYNAVGNILSVTELAQTRNFSYDDLQRLTAGGTAAAPESYSYDGIGNRLTSHLSASHTTNAANRLTEDDDFTYTYDANGNLATKTAKVGGACTGGVTAYTWDAQNQLIRIDFPDLTTATYAYDGLGRRIEKNVNGVITRYVYDAEDILLEYDGTNTLVARYSHGDGRDQPLSVARGGQSFFYQADHQGSVTQITDAAGFVVNAYEYDSYGNIESAVEGVANPFTYTAREFDAESGLYFYRARYYDPEIGRFLNQDPIGSRAGDLNLYRYVFNNPVKFRDPDGTIAAAAPAAVAIVVACATNPICLGLTIGITAGYVIVELYDNITISENEQEEDKPTPPNTPPVPEAEEEPVICPVPIPSDPSQPPGDEWEWRGTGKPGSDQGAWHNPGTDESLHPDLDHPEPVPPHWDYTDPRGKRWRVDPETGIMRPTK